MSSRFVSTRLTELQQNNSSPIFDYQNSVVVTLDEAINQLVPLIPQVNDYVTTAKECCNRDSSLLTQDESAAIYLYTLAVPFFSSLNITLRTQNRRQFEQWTAFLQLLTTALKKLPSIKTTVWRGVNFDDTITYVDDDIHIWWGISSCSMDPKIVQPFVGESGTVFIIEAINGKDITKFAANPDEKELILMPGTHVRRKADSLNLIDRFFIVHLEEISTLSNSITIPNVQNSLFDYIRQEYMENNRLHRIINPAKSFSIEESYINLVIVTTKDQLDKEKQLFARTHSSAIRSTYEEVYGVKDSIDVKDIFKTCKQSKKQVLVFGRAGIGKSTFCRFIAHQWAKGLLWPQYELLAIIPLRRLTANRYPEGKIYSLADLVKKEAFKYELSKKEQELFEEQFDIRKTLWILDGYDEIIQNIPTHLEYLLEQLLETPHHILTSRPYHNTLSYDVQMEITGFTDENITQYVHQFFNQLENEQDSSANKIQSLLKFLKTNSSAFGVAHIPINLELICSIWSNEDLSSAENMTITTLYTMIIDWLCRRYLESKNVNIKTLSESDVHQKCSNELTFLQCLAFKAMETNTIIIRPLFFQEISQETNIFLRDISSILNFGVLKCFSKQGLGNQVELKKDHYFIHLSFQEYFAARYMMHLLEGPMHDKAVAFIQSTKYDQRYLLMFTFISGLLSEFNVHSGSDILWNTILNQPIDLVGIRHAQLIISCLEETTNKKNIHRWSHIVQYVAQLIHHNLSIPNQIISTYIASFLRTTPSILNDQKIIDVFLRTLHCDQPQMIEQLFNFITILHFPNISNDYLNATANCIYNENSQVRSEANYILRKMGDSAATDRVITKLISALADDDYSARSRASGALCKIGEKAVTREMINKLVNVLADEKEWARSSACDVLETIGRKSATNEVISKVVRALTDTIKYDRYSVCDILGAIGEKAATDEVIKGLVSALSDKEESVRYSVCNALGKMGPKAATDEVIKGLVNALSDTSKLVRSSARDSLGRMGQRAATDEVIKGLVNALLDKEESVRHSVCDILGEIGEKAATDEVIKGLVNALSDKEESVRYNACNALGKMGPKAATDEVIKGLVNALSDTSKLVRSSACNALGEIGEKAATDEVIKGLVNALSDQIELVRSSARDTLGRMGEKAATDELIRELVSALSDKEESVRYNACFALGEMGDSAATDRVITKLISALADDDYSARSRASGALCKIGEKAVTREMVNKLLNVLADEKEWVRRSAYVVLETIGRKSATNEVISEVVRALTDTREQVRSSAYYILGEIGEKAATDEVIKGLVSALSDKEESVRYNACNALGEIGEKAATDEVIKGLVNALSDTSKLVRSSARDSLGRMGQKAATDEVIKGLVNALLDKEESVRYSVCDTLSKMGPTAATDEVIKGLVNALSDTSKLVRYSVCNALGKMGPKAATDEVIKGLVNALSDTSKLVRSSACNALGEIGEKAATDEVIKGLVNALSDQIELVRSSACNALGKMGPKAATDEVIKGLVYALSDQIELVRSSARDTLGRMGVKAVTDELIRQLVSALSDKEKSVRYNACFALGEMGEKAVTDKIILKLVSALSDEDGSVRKCAFDTLDKMTEKTVNNKMIVELFNILSKGKWNEYTETVRLLKKKITTVHILKESDLKFFQDFYSINMDIDLLVNIDMKQLLKFWIEQDNEQWWNVMFHTLLLRGIAVTIVNRKLSVQDSKETIEILLPSEDREQLLRESLVTQVKRFKLDWIL